MNNWYTTNGWYITRCACVVHTTRNVLVTAHVEKVLEDVKRARHLAKQQHAVPSGLELGKDAVQQLQLATGSNQLLRVGRLIVGQKQVGVVAGLAEVHGGVLKAPGPPPGVLGNPALLGDLVVHHLSCDVMRWAVM